ncbi:MAG: helix-turn-helix domain-containing protein [Deltaproteobacteria bacterium]|jgi:DNA-binding transcriptional ArsR family regulator|nr:helix-turn-helix domain-containing protein [Deltaproteobacteria bacterium]
MKTREAAKFFEVLSSDVRLEIFRLLVKHEPEGLVAGEIAKRLDLPSTNLSFHLKAITHTGLIGLEKQGRFSRYRANIPLMTDVIDYLTAECCSGHPGCCLKLKATLAALPIMFAQGTDGEKN